jgi:hypothetical protein
MLLAKHTAPTCRRSHAAGRRHDLQTSFTRKAGKTTPDWSSSGTAPGSAAAPCAGRLDLFRRRQRGDGLPHGLGSSVSGHTAPGP